MSPAEGLHKILQATSFYTGGWTPYVGNFGGADNSITFLNSGGRTPEVLVAIDYPNVQLIGRGNKSGNSYDILYNKLQAAKRILHAIQETTGYKSHFPELVSCLVRGEIASLGLDDNQRPLLSLNFELITAPLDADRGNRDLYE